MSDLEKSVFVMIKYESKIYSYKIANTLYKKSKDKPKSASNSVTSIIRQINRKLEKSGADFRIVGQGRGRAGRLVWFEKTPEEQMD